MMKIARVCLPIAILLAACSTTPRQPAMSAAHISPDDLRPGDTAVITVTVTDKFGIVQRVEGVIREDRTITFKLRDDGVAPDETPGDGVWTIQVDVPFNAPPGDFEFEVLGYDSDGQIVVIDDANGEAAPLATSFSLVIQYPEEASE